MSPVRHSKSYEGVDTVEEYDIESIVDPSSNMFNKDDDDEEGIQKGLTTSGRRQDRAKEPRRMGFIGRSRWEWSCSSWFSLKEPDGEDIDVVSSFAPPGRLVLNVRLFFLAWSASAFAAHVQVFPLSDDIMGATGSDGQDYPTATTKASRKLFMAYYPHWVWVVSISYQFTVLFLSSVCRRCFLKQPHDGDPPNVLVRLAWILYSVALPSQVLLAVAAFCVPDQRMLTDGFHERSLMYFVILVHAIVGSMIFTDGFLVAAIPLRLKHIIFVEVFWILYFLWLAIHDSVGLGNISSNLDNGNDSNDDALYKYISWTNRPLSTLGVMTALLFGIIPISYTLLWFLTLFSFPFDCTGKRRKIYNGPLGGL